jgi:hypothetical protein
MSILLLSSVVAAAAPFVGSITFQGLTGGQDVGDYYKSDGIFFTGFTAVAGDYYTCLDTTDTCSASLGPGAVMDVQPGFVNGLSFYFKTGSTGEVLLYDQLDGQGMLLADVALDFDTFLWNPFGFNFNGVAQSAVFNGNMEVAVVTMGGGMVLPEPSTILLSLPPWPHESAVTFSSNLRSATLSSPRIPFGIYIFFNI